ncbi:MAG: OadG family protein, partial [Oscillospiraceae bacterium]|nr:OadG family protein [Oscillospiraceae bacterium]
MNTLALTAANLGIGGSGIAAVLGYAVVFFGLVLLMCVVILMGKAMAGTNKKAEAKA